MRQRNRFEARSRNLLLLVALLSVAGIIFFKKPVAVQYHRLAMRTWHSQKEWEKWTGHQQALVNLEYFEVRDFRLRNRLLTNKSALMRLVDRAPFHDGQWTVTTYTNRIRVTAFGGDMELWERTVKAFDHPKGI